VLAATARSLILVLGVALTLTGLLVLLHPNSPRWNYRRASSISGSAESLWNRRILSPLRATRSSSGSPPTPRANSTCTATVSSGKSGRTNQQGSRFEADLTGRCEIEDHETEEELGRLVVEPR
jgi:hypothetical protein